MTNVGIRLIGAAEIITRTTIRAKTLPKEVQALVTYWGNILNSQIKANASGRPGPNAPTGNYRRSWVHTVTTTADGVKSVNGTNMPQGRRLEYGFHGADSLGRVYDQPPFPHVGPAVDKVVPQLVRAHDMLLRTI